MVYSIKGPIGNQQSEIGNIICSHSNHRGDVIARSDSNGSLTSFALYEAYGTRPYEWGDDPDRQRANTKEEETNLGLLNEGMRYRDLETGVFLTRDPIGYGDGPNVYCYVHCNPITKFDPLGLSWWNPLTHDFAAYEAAINTGRHLSEAGRQIKGGHPILAARVTVGVATSTLSGDIFDEKNNVDAQATGVSVNGILNDYDKGAVNLESAADAATGQVTQRVKNDSHFLGIGDLVQCVSESLGAINTPSLNYADTMRKMADNHPNGTLEATAHSQGGSVLNGGSKLLDPKINQRTSVQPFGAQLAAKNDGTFKNAYNQRASGGLLGDPVPFLDPRNWGNLLSGNVHGDASSNGHPFMQNYGENGIKKAEVYDILDDMSKEE